MEQPQYNMFERKVIESDFVPLVTLSPRCLSPARGPSKPASQPRMMHTVLYYL